MKFKKTILLGLTLAFVSCLPGCGNRGGQKVTKYPSGQTRVDNLQGGRKTHSQWYATDGQLVFETVWTQNGDGIDYAFHPNGELKEKITVENNLRNGPTWIYDEDGTCTSAVEYLDGVAVPTS